MDVYNLAICFGPTLVPVPEEKDQVQYQNLVNDLIKNIILFHEDIFPSSSEIGGLAYEKYISREPDDVDVGDSPSDHAQEDIDSEVYPSEDGTYTFVCGFGCRGRDDGFISPKGKRARVYDGSPRVPSVYCDSAGARLACR